MNAAEDERELEVRREGGPKRWGRKKKNSVEFFSSQNAEREQQRGCDLQPLSRLAPGLADSCCRASRLVADLLRLLEEAQIHRRPFPCLERGETTRSERESERARESGVSNQEKTRRIPSLFPPPGRSSPAAASAAPRDEDIEEAWTTTIKCTATLNTSTSSTSSSSSSTMPSNRPPPLMQRPRPRRRNSIRHRGQPRLPPPRLLPISSSLTID